MSKIRLVIAGPRGKMGSEAVAFVSSLEQYELVAVLDRINGGKSLKMVDGFPKIDVPIYTNIEECFQEQKVDILIDLTTPETGFHHTKMALQYGVRPVVGTTGFTAENIAELEAISRERGLGGIIAPNFALGAVLMMKFAKMAGKYFQDIEIIEMHHNQKLDAPSGTAVKTAEMIAEVREAKTQGHQDEKETIKGARGANYDGMHIHSVRLPGLVAHQQVIFGSEGQTLTLRHDSFHRASFMSGVKLALETVLSLDTLVYGLENLID